MPLFKGAVYGIVVYRPISPFTRKVKAIEAEERVDILNITHHSTRKTKVVIAFRLH
jgi:hypothetical protein